MLDRFHDVIPKSGAVQPGEGSHAPMKSSDVAVRHVTSDLAFHSQTIRLWFLSRGVGKWILWLQLTPYFLRIYVQVVSSQEFAGGPSDQIPITPMISRI